MLIGWAHPSSPLQLADRLVGIYKTDNCTKSIAINPAAFTVPTAPMGDRTNAPALR